MWISSQLQELSAKYISDKEMLIMDLTLAVYYVNNNTKHMYINDIVVNLIYEKTIF